jgi:uncharacterized YccA/Bax inhibitor family protein
MSNPVLNSKKFKSDGSESMTMQGTINKTLILFGILMVTASLTWTKTIGALKANEVVAVGGSEEISRLSYVPDGIIPLVLGGCLIGFVVAMIIIFFQKSAPVLAPVYAALEGVFIGGLSAMFEYMYPNIAIQAAGLTLAVFFAMLALYKARIIRATEKFRAGLMSAMIGILILYLVDLFAGMAGYNLPLINDTGFWGIALSLFIVTIASLNLILDFDMIETGVASKAPKYMEWYAGFGLMVTLVWLYLEILRLLAKLRGND